MLRRQVTFPVAPDRLWTELTEPDAASEWLGLGVTWELVPGAPARFDGGRGPSRGGRIEEVIPGHRLRFVWWPEEPGAGVPAGVDGEPAHPGPASEVTYDLRPDGDGTELTVTERVVEPAAGAPGAAQASVAGAWSPWDGRLVGLWAAATVARVRA